MSDISCGLANLSLASFRGVSFWVESDKEDYGRRIVTHEYPNRDAPYNEDLGEKAQKFSVTAYVTGDDATSKKEAVVAACRARGSAMLQLPAKAAFLAVLTSLAVQRSKDEQSFFKLQMEFTADPMFGSPIALGQFEALIGSSLLGVVAPLTAAFNAAFQAVGVLPFVMMNAVSRIVNFASTALSVIDGISGVTHTDLTAQITTDLIGLAQNAEALVRPGPSDPASSTVISVLGDVFYNSLAAYAPADLIPAMTGLATYTFLEAVDAAGNATYGNDGLVTGYNMSALGVATPGAFIQIPSTSVLADEANAAAFNGAVRNFALIALASAVSATTFASRADAIQARANLVELFGQQLERTTDETVAQALMAARNYAVTAVSSSAADLSQVVVITAPMSLPSIYWAARLYGDAAQAEALVDRNSVPTPAFMPRQFEALSAS